VSLTAVAAVSPRRRVTVRGEVVSVVSYERPWVRTDAEMTDGTGSVVLRFLGRAAVPGLVVGRRMEAEGTAALVRGLLVLVNPLYSFTRVG
jgi:hypothetical protein